MKSNRIVLPFVILGVLIGLGTGRAVEPPPAAPSQSSQPSIVTIRIVTDASQRCNKAYDPPVVTIQAGTTVEWTNEDYETHTLVSSAGGESCNQKELPSEARVIDVGQLLPTAQYRQTFTKPGEYPYTCHLPFHHMSGKIIVVP
ncbi:MAG: plastocyanin/azurin family copper-binding protein [Nitrospirota bacterium]